jgi:hypothetical protein
MSKTLYDEAIADAKRLREVAEQNAKNAIVEAVTPRIREFIDSQLVGDTTKSVSAEKFLVDALNEGAVDHSAEEEVVLDEAALKSLVSLFTPKQTTQAKDSFQEAFDQLSDSEKKKLLNLISEEKEDADLDENEESAPAQEMKMDDSLYEIDLNELKKELAAAASPGKPAVKPAMKPMPPKAGGMKKSPAPAMEDMFEMDEDLYEMDMSDGMDEDYMNELNEMKLEVDLGDLELPEDFMPSVRVVPEEEEEDMLADDGDMGDMGDMPAADGEVADEVPPAPVAETFYVDENMLRRELTRLREARKQKEDKLLNKKSLKSSSHVKAAAKSFGDATIEEVDEVEINALDTAKKHKLKKLEEARANRALVTQLNEYRSAVETLREQMTDMNLFNAKLLYVNKMLQSKDLTPKQQKVVIEAIDGAKTLREVKMLYKSLTESLTGGNGATLNESASRFNAGGSSRATSSAAARTTETTEVDRWARLAGLK